MITGTPRNQLLSPRSIQQWKFWNISWIIWSCFFTSCGKPHEICGKQYREQRTEQVQSNPVFLEMQPKYPPERWAQINDQHWKFSWTRRTPSFIYIDKPLEMEWRGENVGMHPHTASRCSYSWWSRWSPHGDSCTKYCFLTKPKLILDSFWRLKMTKIDLILS